MDKRDKSLIALAGVLVLAAAWWAWFYFFGETAPSGEQIVLDLVDEEVRADFVADTPGFIFGTEAGKARYREVDFRYHDQTRGWVSWHDGERSLDGAILVGGRAAFYLTVLDPGPAVLALKGCGVEEERDTGFRVHLNGRLLGEGTLPKGREINRFRFEIEREALGTGENRFEIEVDGGVQAPLLGFSFPLTLSAFFVSASLKGVKGPHPAMPVAEGRGRAYGKSIAQPSGTLLHYYCLPAMTDRLKTSVSVKGSSLPVAVIAQKPGGEFVELFAGILEKGLPPREMDLDLSVLAGEACRITLVSGKPGKEKAGAYVRWTRPRIVRGEGTLKSNLASKGAKSHSLQDPGGKPDILIILLDAASAFFFECLGADRVVAPAAEALVDDAVVFETAVTPAPYTLPAVGSIMTGELPDRHGVVFNANRDGVNMRLSSRTATLASALKEAGYATFGVVTNPNTASLYGYGKGFDRFEELFKDPALWNEGVEPGRAVERAKQLIQEHRARNQGPFFLYLHLFQPHAPYTPPESFTSRFVDTAQPYEGPVDGSRAVIDGFKEKGDPPLNEHDFAHLKNLYAANLAYADAAAGDLLSWLRSEGLHDDAMIVLCSDHGEAFGEHRSIEHGHHLYEETVRIPLLVKYPRSRFKSTRVKDVVSLTDLAPTLASAAGARTAPHRFSDGLDLTPFLEGRFSWPERVHLARSDVFKPSYALRWRGYQYIYDALNRREELYYLPDDPAQATNLVETSPVVSGYLRTRLCRILCTLLKEGGGEAVELDDGFIQSVQNLGYTGGGGQGAPVPDRDHQACPISRKR